MRKLDTIIYSGVLLCSLVLAFSSSTPGSVTPKKVLIFSSESYRPNEVIVDRAIRETLGAELGNQVTFYNEAQDSARIPNDKYEAEYVNFLSQKYRDHTFDLVFVRGAPGIRFILKHETELFTGVPKVFITNDRRELAGLELGNNFTGVFGTIEYGPTLDLILQQLPMTKKVVVITGGTIQDESYLEDAKRDFSGYTGRVEIRYLSRLSIPDLQGELSALPPDNVCLFISYGRDPAGNGYSIPEVMSLLGPFLNVPIYGLADTAIGTGVVGGNMLSFQLMGKRASEIGLRMLSGVKPSAIPPQTVESVPMFDWRQLSRWNISENALPQGSIVNYKEPTAWEQYKWEIVGIGVFTIFQTLLIGWLLVIRARRNKAEEESLRFAAIAEAQHRKLDAVVGNVPGIVWESRVVPGSDDRRIEFVSDYVEKTLGYTPEEISSIPNFWSTIVVEEDQKQIRDITAAIFDGQPAGVQQFRCTRKDGRVIWIDAHLAPVVDESENVAGIRGVAIEITDRKLAEEKLRSREVELTEAQRLSQIGSWEWDPESDTVTWTEELYRIAGIDPSEPAPTFRQHAQLYTRESFDRLAAAVASALQTGETYEMELEMVRRDGLHRWASARGEVLRDDDNNNILKLRGTLQDITASKEAEQALSESEERYRNVVETQTELICRYLPDTTLTFVNDAYCRYFGKTREELIGVKFMDLIPAEARPTAIGHVEELLRHGHATTYEHEVIRPNGKRGWQQWVDNVVVTTNGHSRELQGIGRDITEKRQAEEELRASEIRFRIMADSAPVLIWMCGPDKLCTYVNQGWLVFTGRSLEMELGSGWTVSIHPDDADRTSEIFDSAFMRREPFRLEYRLRGADGAFRWVYDSGTPRFSSEGEFLGYIGSCVDISDRKKAEEASKQAHEEVVRLQKQLQEENIYLKEVIKLEHGFEEIIGHCDALKYVLFKVEQVAPTDATVLISGETGTGKELVARAVHSTSLRKNRPLVKVNCAALSASLIESELFGHERGSFTGASSRKIGRFELADGATIFLDEVGELPIELQVKLLRIIQEGEFERLGSSKTLKVDVRIIAATNRDLEAEVKKGTFREDLLFRLNVFPITVPPLRERKDDIPELIEYFTSRFAKKLGKNIRSVSPASIRRLSEHTWPGNIRELANVIERSVINTQTETLSVSEIFAKPAAANTDTSFGTLEMIERKHITQILELTNWKIEGANGAARILDLNPSTLRTRMSKLGIAKSRTMIDKTHLQS